MADFSANTFILLIPYKSMDIKIVLPLFKGYTFELLIYRNKN
jgi:hypothetical protein